MYFVLIKTYGKQQQHQQTNEQNMQNMINSQRNPGEVGTFQGIKTFQFDAKFCHSTWRKNVRLDEKSMENVNIFRGKRQTFISSPAIHMMTKDDEETNDTFFWTQCIDRDPFM